MHSASSCQGCDVIYNIVSPLVCICLFQSGFFIFFFRCSTGFTAFEGQLTKSCGLKLLLESHDEHILNRLW